MNSNGSAEATLVEKINTLASVKRSAAAFRKTETVKLPSGLAVEARRVDVSRLIMEAPEDSAPRFLVNQFAGSIGNVGGVELPTDSPSEALRKMSRFMDIVVKAAVTWPVIVDQPTADDEIAISDLDMADRQFIFTWVMPQTKAE